MCLAGHTCIWRPRPSYAINNTFRFPWFDFSVIRWRTEPHFGNVSRQHDVYVIHEARIQQQRIFLWRCVHGIRVFNECYRLVGILCFPPVQKGPVRNICPVSKSTISLLCTELMLLHNFALFAANVLRISSSYRYDTSRAEGDLFPCRI